MVILINAARKNHILREDNECQAKSLNKHKKTNSNGRQTKFKSFNCITSGRKHRRKFHYHG